MTARTVGDVLQNRQMLELGPNISVSEAAKMMRLRKVSSILVVDEGRLVGVLTERDIVFRVVAAGQDIDRTRIGRVMTSNPIFVTPKTTVLAAIRQMKQLQLRHLPVIWPDAPPGEPQVLGVVSVRDFIGEDVHALEALEQEIGEDVSSLVKTQ